MPWGIKGDLAGACAALGLKRAAIVQSERPVEAAVSLYLARLPFMWIDIDDEPGPSSLRGYLERNAIALLSNARRFDPPSENWLGRHSNRVPVRASGVWNQRHVEESYDPAFLEVLERHVR